jgi:L-lactate dehydrogenase complex protein LldE
MPPEHIQLFRTCLIDSFFKNTLLAIIATLEAAGLDVDMPSEQTCCGQPAYNAGFWGEARKIAQHTIRTFEATEGTIVVPSGSCAHMIRHGYPRIFQGDQEWEPRTRELASRTYEWSEFIVEILGVKGFVSAFTGTIAYHPSCHLLRGLHVHHPPISLLENSFEESQVFILDEECCGFGGVFAVEHPDLSTTILDRKIDQILSTQADIVTGCDISCLMQIEGRLRRMGSKVRCVHLAELFTDQDDVGKS